MSLHVALLAQRLDIKEDPMPTDVMVYRQPLSDVPVPAAWRPSKPVPLDGVDLDVDEEAEGGSESNAADMHIDGFERYTEPRRIGERHPRVMGARLSALLLGSAVTCTLVGWVSLI
jgi:hypothetical protein